MALLPDTDRLIGDVATANHGVATRTLLLKAGVTDAEMRHRLDTGALLGEHPGVYRVGHRAPNTKATYHAAVLACGPGAVLYGLAAAHLLGLIRGEPPEPMVMTRNLRDLDGITTRRYRKLARADVGEVDGIRVTSPARTLLDLAGVLDGADLARAAHEAGVKHGTTPRQVKAAMGRRQKAPGAAKLRAIMEGDVKVVLSKLEAKFLKLLKDEGLPLPDTNKRIGARRVDFHWTSPQVTVEVDGYRYHRSRHAWDKDYARALEARARGDEFRRYSHEDVTKRGRLVRQDLRRLLHHGR